jgi:hypothetical protein
MTQERIVYIVANGDLRQSANCTCWPAQQRVEDSFIKVLQAHGWEAKRAHAYDPAKGHGFIDSQKAGIKVFHNVPASAPVVVIEAVWQYSQHLLPGLIAHRGPILTVANWSGEWPGLVGLLNLNASLTKAKVRYSTLWSVDFKDEYFLRGLHRWLQGEQVSHDDSHVQRFSALQAPSRASVLGAKLARDLRTQQSIMGVFDEGCMGMYNAIIPDELLFASGVFKERLSQSALYAEMLSVPDSEAVGVRRWLEHKGMRFEIGSDPEKDLTDEQILAQCKMYIAALRIADDFGCDAIGIQYQQGLKDLLPASDLAEGLLNNVDRPPVAARGNGRILYPGSALPHFNEADECAGLDALVTNRVWTELGLAPETTLHDVRYGESYPLANEPHFVWLFEISGAVPPAHLQGGYQGAVSMRQRPEIFRLGGGTIRGVSKPGEIVWSRVFIEADTLRVDLGRGSSVQLPDEENERRWNLTNPEWPIMNAVLNGVSQTQLMGRHKSNHIQVAYAPNAAAANLALATKATMFHELGLQVSICGNGHGMELQG